MADDSKIKDIIEAVAGLAKEVPIYQDALQPAAKELGKGLEIIAETVVAAIKPLKVFIWGYEQVETFLKTKVAHKLAAVPPEDIITPKANIAIPAIQGAALNDDDPEIQDVYAELLAAAMNRKTAGNAHPSFPEIIKQLTSDEVKIIKYLAANSYGPHPVVTLVIEKIDENSNVVPGGLDFIKHYSHIGYKAGCDHPVIAYQYLYNLSRLRLIEILNSVYTDMEIYAELENDKNIKIIKAVYKSNGGNIKLLYNALEVTSFGRKLMRACGYFKGDPKNDFLDSENMLELLKSFQSLPDEEFELLIYGFSKGYNKPKSY